MSGESGRSSRPSVGQKVRPEPVIEKTFVENVAGFINEVAPQTYSNPSHYEGKETITWVRFDHCDINDLAQFRDKIEVNGNSPPLLLIVGYVCGVQVWVIPVNGEAVEVLSWRQGAVRTLKVLPSPTTSSSAVDIYSLKRPIIALCDSAGPGPQFCSVTFISLKTGEQVKTIKFKNPIHDIHSNKNIIVISFPEKLAVFDATNLEDTFTVTTCYPCPGPSLNPVALGDRWLAYADRRLVPLHQSCGGMVPEGSTSYKATVFHAAKSLTKGLKELGESMASNLMGQRGGGSPAQQPPPTNHPTPGVVTVLDTQLVGCGEINLQSSGTSSGIVAHFGAHHAAPVVALQFDPTGMLLLTADKQGHNFHLFRLQPHPLSSAQAAVHHLYTLHRGDTTAKVIDISFSLDSRWVAVSTHRGTTHVFPITPYGGNIGVRTHTSSCVVNRLSRFHRSAGLDDTPSSGRNSPVLSASPNPPKSMFELSPNLAYPNPRYPPYPTPTSVKPLVQLRQPLLQNLIGTIASSGPSPSRSPPINKTPRSPSGDDVIRVASVFGSPRGWLAGSPTVPRDKQRRTMDSLFIMAYHGNLLEYHLEPHCAAGIPHDKVTEDSPIELEVHASAQWSLIRESTSGEIRPPLDLSSPLLAPLSPTRPRSLSPAHSFDHDDPEERWMAQVEIHTHAGPHRRLWMGPQFTFKCVPGIGHGGVGVQGSYEGTAVTALSSGGRPPRSSPVNMPGTGGANVPVLIEAGSLTGSHDQSPRLMERYSGDSDSFDPETMMTQLRHDLADAMMDTQHPSSHSDTGEDGGMSSHGTAAYESTLDMTDVMDISCDPPGPSSSRTRSSCTSPSVSLVSSRPSSHVGEEVQAVTTRLHQVAVTQSDSSRASPLIVRTPSFEDNRTLTSSAEELSSTLGVSFSVVDQADSTWVPIDRPKSKSHSRSPEFVQIDHPRPAWRSNRQSVTSSGDMHLLGRSESRTSIDEDKLSDRETKKSPRPSSSEAVIKSHTVKEHFVLTSASRVVTTDGNSMTSSRSSNKSESESKVSAEISSSECVVSVRKEDCESMSGCLGTSSTLKDNAWQEGKHKDSRETESDSVKEGCTYKAWTRSSPVRGSSPENSGMKETFQPQEEAFPALVRLSSSPTFTDSAKESRDSSSETRSSSKFKKPSSATTSEDDLWLSSENKRDKKKKKKKIRQSSPEEESQYSAELTLPPAPPTISGEMSESAELNMNRDALDDGPSGKIGCESIPAEMDVEADYFHAAEEYHEPDVAHRIEEFEGEYQKEFFCEPQTEEFQEAQESVTHTLEDFELKPDEEEPQEAMLRSMHDDNDLAKALEEAYSSDDNVPVRTKSKTRTHSRSRPSRTSEMFPFKEDTSDDEDEVKLRRRVIVSGTASCVTSRSSVTDETSTDDREETSGDDRAESSTDDIKTATSESDVGASPNPRASSSSKNKKKKKKKR